MTMSKQPLVLAYGMGRDSTAVLVGWHKAGIRPTAITFADVGSEKPGTYAYLPIINKWLKKIDFPQVTVVKYVPKIAPYTTIEGNCSMNCTLPSEAFGRGACTIKWKLGPQNKWCKDAFPHIFASDDLRIVKAIGYEFNELGRKEKMEKAKGKLLEKENEQRAAKTAKKHASLAADKHYEYRYPLIEWEWTLEQCIDEIRAEGLPVPPKSSCYFCPNMRPEEVRELSPELLGRIMRMEILAEPYNQSIYGLWRKPRKRDARPGSMTEFILQEGLEYVYPDDLPDEMPMNPKCGKADRGYTFHPPHRNLSLQELVDKHQQRLQDGPDLFDIIEDAGHREIIDSI